MSRLKGWQKAINKLTEEAINDSYSGNVERAETVDSMFSELNKCPCNLPTCVESWEPGCGLGNSEQHAKVEKE